MVRLPQCGQSERRAFFQRIVPDVGERRPSSPESTIMAHVSVQGDPADIYLGTDDGEPVKRLLQSNPLAVWRRRSLRGILQAAGYIVSPAHPGIPETGQVNGGYKTATYGS